MPKQSLYRCVQSSCASCLVPCTDGVVPRPYLTRCSVAPRHQMAHHEFACTRYKQKETTCANDWLHHFNEAGHAVKKEITKEWRLENEAYDYTTKQAEGTSQVATIVMDRESTVELSSSTAFHWPCTKKIKSFRPSKLFNALFFLWKWSFSIKDFWCTWPPARYLSSLFKYELVISKLFMELVMNWWEEIYSLFESFDGSLLFDDEWHLLIDHKTFAAS